MTLKTNAETNEHIWIMKIPSSYGGGGESVRYNSDSQAISDSLEAGVEFQWRVDICGANGLSGSESQWTKHIF